ncbi:hypothetical protein HK101_005051, partial [Irineochytrium annulatum]
MPRSASPANNRLPPGSPLPQTTPTVYPARMGRSKARKVAAKRAAAASTAPNLKPVAPSVAAVPTAETPKIDPPDADIDGDSDGIGPAQLKSAFKSVLRRGRNRIPKKVGFNIASTAEDGGADEEDGNKARLTSPEPPAPQSPLLQSRVRRMRRQALVAGLSPDVPEPGSDDDDYEDIFDEQEGGGDGNGAKDGDGNGIEEVGNAVKDDGEAVPATASAPATAPPTADAPVPERGIGPRKDSGFSASKANLFDIKRAVSAAAAAGGPTKTAQASSQFTFQFGTVTPTDRNEVMKDAKPVTATGT